MNKILKIYEDKDYVIAVSNDYWKALVVQVCCVSVKQKQDAGKIVEDRSIQLAWEKRVEMVKYDPSKNIVPVDAVSFRKSAIEAIQEAKNQLSKLQEVDRMFQGLSKDLESQLKNNGGPTA